MADTGIVNIGSPSFFDNEGNVTTDQPPFEISWETTPWLLTGARSRNRNVNVTFLSLLRTGNAEIEVDTSVDVERENTFGFRLHATDASKTYGWQIRPDTRNPYISNIAGGVATRRYRAFYDSIRTTDSFVLLWDKNGIPNIPPAANVTAFHFGGVQHTKLYAGGVEHRLLYAGGNVIYRAA